MAELFCGCSNQVEMEFSKFSTLGGRHEMLIA